jgi:hypothetical protein
MRRLLAVFLLLGLPLLAQEAKKPETAAAEPPQQIQKLFILKYADPVQIANLLRVFNAVVTPNSEMHALAVRATEPYLPAIEDAIKRLDVPATAPKNIELTVYFLAGNAGQNTTGEPVPKDLDSVVTQLKGNFPYTQYRLLDVLTLRTRSGQPAEASSIGSSVTVEQASQPIINQFRVSAASVNPDGTTIRIDRMKAGERIPVVTGKGELTYIDVGYSADGLDIKEGQKVVVGRLGASKDQALFLVLMAKVMQ